MTANTNTAPITHIRVIDMETTGLTPDCHVIELGAWDLRKSKTGWLILPLGSTFVHPPTPVPSEISAITGITTEMCHFAPMFRDAAVPFLEDAAVFCAHNSKLERQHFTDEMTCNRPWLDTYKIAATLWGDSAPNLKNGTLLYHLALGRMTRDLCAPAHRAGPDAYVTALILQKALERHSVEDLLRISERPVLLPKIFFGQHRGKTWAEMDDGFLQWVLGKDFDEDVMHTAEHHLRKREAARTPAPQEAPAASDVTKKAASLPLLKAMVLDIREQRRNAGHWPVSYVIPQDDYNALMDEVQSADPATYSTYAEVSIDPATGEILLKVCSCLITTLA